MPNDGFDKVLEPAPVLDAKVLDKFFEGDIVNAVGYPMTPQEFMENALGKKWGPALIRVEEVGGFTQLPSPFRDTNIGITRRQADFEDVPVRTRFLAVKDVNPAAAALDTTRLIELLDAFGDGRIR